MQGTIAAKLPPNLLKLFAPRPPPPFFKPVGKDPDEPGPNKLQGVAAVVQRLKEEDEERVFKRDTEGQGTEGEAVEKKFTLALEYQKQLRKEEAKKQKEEYKKNLEKNYNPNEDPNAAGDPYKTLFISRLSKKTTEEDLRREFEMYGKIERIRIVKDKKGKSKSYAFIVYERERDMKAAYKDAEGIPIHHKKILVDVERGRTVKGWKPRKLGGGLGGRPKPVDPAAAAVAPPFGFQGGFRGGMGGGFRGGFSGRGGPMGGRGGFVPRGSFGGRGGFRGGFNGGGGFNGPPGGFQNGPPGGFQNGPPGGDRGGFRGGFQGGSSRGGFDGGRGGFGGGFDGGAPPQNRGFDGPPNAVKRDFGGDAGPGGAYGGGAGYGGDNKRPRY